MAAEPRIFIAGHQGMVGSAIMRALQANGYTNLVTRSHSELDLTDQAAVRAFFRHERIDQVYLAAAKVGGIFANNTYPADFIYQNLMIQTNVIHEAWKGGVKKLLFLGSSCIYPRDCPQPIKEEYLQTGPMEETNRSYAHAKISGIEMCWAYNRQFGTKFLVVMPTNLFGPGDNYDAQNSHVVPALIRKIHDAKANGSNSIVVWGSGTPLREFLYSNDMADACLHLMDLPEDQFEALVSPQRPPMVNVGSGVELSIRDMALLIMKIADHRCELIFDPSKPDGTPRKLLDCSILKNLGWIPKTDLWTALTATYSDYQYLQCLNRFQKIA